MIAAIFLKDRMNMKESKPIENFTFDVLKDGIEPVKTRLKKLQSGYCEKGDSKPKIRLAEVDSKKTPGKKIKIIYAESEADFFYVAYLATNIKTLPV